ncbi:MAG TPA: glycosyltransferase family 4 protein [Pyrinomonadaceae bacterium]|jgi:glycosyltransferase involved in cell wall biosynthesis|nr:glycosyltransferase family 4 protein [Pyrinomonadaceae bacterium]
MQAKPRRRFLAAVGDSNNPVTWSGIPFHFLQAARAAGLLDEGLPLSTDGRVWQARRVAWNLSRVFKGDRRGGYQYSESFLERLWRPVRNSVQGGIVVNCFQLFAPSIVRDQTVEKWFFIDQTLQQLFDYYEQRPLIGRRIAHESIAREREGYHAARGIIVHSRWAARSVVNDYGVSPERVYTVMPGANIDPTEYARWEKDEEQHRAANIEHEQRPLRLVFVGKYWHRKGLDRLLGALALARRRGSLATLRVIGCRRETLPAHLRNTEGVEWSGFLDKRNEAHAFLCALGECDIGCLLSRAEAGGIAFREYHALGLPVIGTDTGGAPDHMLPGASVIVSTNSTDEEISRIIMDLERDGARLKALRKSARQQRHLALWDETVRKIKLIWADCAEDDSNSQPLERERQAQYQIQL